MQAWDSDGQPAVEVAQGSGNVKKPNSTKLIVPLAMAVASATKAYQKKLYFEALGLVSSSPLHGEARRCCTVSLPLALLTLTPHYPQEEP